MDIRIGTGTDLHILKEGIPLMVGGVHIPNDKGSFGHSDGDVLLHAICDSLLGAACLGDIGSHFSDQDPAYLGIDSRKLLKSVANMIDEAGYKIINIDSVVHLQSPKLSPYIRDIQIEIEKCIGLSSGTVSVKAKTAEKTGSVGEGKAIKAEAVCLLSKR